ncbi:alpha/beta-hydrolase family protein [Nocardia blacklockiae]|uniref:alpha/beta-hydrolase family protein n=1 Tax=Nocardia blacklockiae TaxID=480036 RepID=UPI001895F6D4|nr:alpha/beta-hydrolase family protein [Nocardia blacklockiae]MBF6173648.1 alpha/beta-hydrolase family protein [Nocardia blacklockiae]
MSATLAGPEARRGRLELHPPTNDRPPRPRFRLRNLRTPPRIGTSLAVTLGAAASLSPGLLPRTATAQAILTGLLVSLALAVAGVLRAVTRRRGFDINRALAGARTPVALVGTLVVLGAIVRAQQWQNELRAAMGVPAVAAGHWVRCALGAALLAAILVGTVRGLRWVFRRLGRTRTVGIAVVAALAAQFVLLPAVVDWRRAADAAANATVDPALVQPVSITRSGSTESAVGWGSLGAEGRKFVAGPASRAVRLYVGLNSAPDLDSRVALAIRELERSGGLNRSHLVVTVPTGSGWIDARAAEGLEERFAGDVALVGLQYSEAPSWATFVFGRRAAEQSARALFTAVEQRLATLAHKPRLYVYGQSLGATAGSAIFADETEQRSRVCAALWAGPPAGRVHRAGATVLANSSDPVVHWSPELLWRAPDLTGTRTDAPRPHWLPVLGFVQTTADLLTALSPPPGHGHRYGADQGTALGDC